MDVLVAYDISTVSPRGEQRLAQVAAACERYGVRTQYSLFECRLTPAGLQKLIGELCDLINPNEDLINIYRLDQPIDKLKSSYGRKPATSLGQPWIIS